MLKDKLTQKIGVLLRRETEARILIPFVEELIKAFGKEETLNILEKTIIQEAKIQGKEPRKQPKETPKENTKETKVEKEVKKKEDEN